MSQISQTTPFKKKAPLKVFGGRLNGKQRVIMAASSQRVFMDATGIGRDFFSVTGNKKEIAQALSAPGVAFYRDAHAQEDAVWHRLKPRKAV